MVSTFTYPSHHPFRLRFVGRENEFATCLQFLGQGGAGRQSGSLLVRGDSGTGKSYFVKELLFRQVTSTPEVLSLYLDIHDDEFASTRVYQSLIGQAWHGAAATLDHPINVPDAASYSIYLERRSVNTDVVRYVCETVRSSLDLLPIAGAARASFPGREDALPGPATRVDIDAALFDYIQTTAAERHVVLTLDNYQFLSQYLRWLTEARLKSITTGLTFIMVDRTLEGRSVITSPIPFQARPLHLILGPFSYLDTIALVRSALSLSEERAAITAHECWEKTRGNLKEIEFYVTNVMVSLRSGVGAFLSRTFLDTIRALPMLERNLLCIAALFPGGLRIGYVLATLRRLILLQDERELEVVIHELVALRYLIVNSRTGEMLKPAHEKIVSAIRATMSDEETLELRHAAMQAFDEILAEGVETKEYHYLLSCLIGILNAREAIQRIDRVAALVDIEYRTDNFHRVVLLYKNPEMQQILAHLPRHVVESFLDSFQKTSEFQLGLVAVTRLRAASVENRELTQLYEAKYLTQIYRYPDALQILDGLPENDTTLLYRLNILQCLCKDEEAKRLVDDVRARSGSAPSLERAVILRNSAHLYPFDEAQRNLLVAYNYFRQTGATFEEATALNNIGVVHAWAGDYESAERTMDAARTIFEGLASNEVYQALLNLGAMWAGRRRFADALACFKQAHTKTPRSLHLDQLNVEANIHLAQLALGELSGQGAAKMFIEFHRDSRQIPDPRLHAQLAYNRYRLGVAFSVEPGIGLDEASSPQVTDRGRTGYELFTDLTVGATSVSVLWIMSPHWRY